jgi:ankyrin repeat protein
MVVRALCSYGALDLHPASINTRFPGLNSFTQLHIAMRRGDVMAAQMLLAGGADVNATDVWGNSPLMYWPVVPAQPAELVEELVGKLLSHVSAADSGRRGPQAPGWSD